MAGGRRRRATKPLPALGQGGTGWGPLHRTAFSLAQELPTVALAVQDRDGLCGLHHLCFREPSRGLLDVIEWHLQRTPNAANLITYMTSKPPGWSCLHHLCDRPLTDGHQQWGEQTARQLLVRCSTATVNAQTNKLATAAHFAARRGHGGVLTAIVRDGRMDWTLEDGQGNAALPHRCCTRWGLPASVLH